MNVFQDKFIHNSDEMEVVCITIGLIDPYCASIDARKIYNSLSIEEKEEIKRRIKK